MGGEIACFSALCILSLPISIDPIGLELGGCSPNLGNEGESSAILELMATDKDGRRKKEEFFIQMVVS